MLKLLIAPVMLNFLITVQPNLNQENTITYPEPEDADTAGAAGVLTFAEGGNSVQKINK